MDFPLVISFYTPGGVYEEEMRRLRRSLVKWGLEHEIVELVSRGSWVNNCSMKGPFIRDKLMEVERPILWLDADAEVCGVPALLRGWECDLGAYTVRHYHSGTVFINWTKMGRNLAALWSKKCTEEPGQWDQRTLASASRELQKTGLVLGALPQGYCKIFDRRWTPHEDQKLIVLHHQASRRAKKRRKK